MSISDQDVSVDEFDVAMILEGLAEVLELPPPANDGPTRRDQAHVAAAARAGAALIAKQIDAREGEQSYAAGKLYGEKEWHHAVLRAVLGTDGAVRALGMD
ncbi:hypothetical protein [Arsenicicoccus dermatophilus]|uniref:hypothetical protein n=1 Tax=Arsenicicoccus dermatophilus TaxID=1076331 RepID=UPI001F4C553C|nr:hypothetical protein [Arsenicicoccus dermatophilus]MCH8614391.1 hypothetical protein [Arsenicicoccus dermatophilus]